MDLVTELEMKLKTVRQLGYTVSYDWFGGTGGGACQVGQQKMLFLDLALGTPDHLATVNGLLNRELPPSGKQAA